MTHYSVQPKDQIFVTGYRFVSFAKNICSNTGKSISKILSIKYSQKFLDYAQQSAKDVLKSHPKRTNQKKAEKLVI